MEMINQIGSIAKYVWNVEMRLLHNYFDMLQTQQLSTWPKTSLHLLPLKHSLYVDVGKKKLNCNIQFMKGRLDS